MHIFNKMINILKKTNNVIIVDQGRSSLYYTIPNTTLSLSLSGDE